MNLLVIDESLHCGTTGAIMCILQFVNKYIKLRNIAIEDILNLYIYKNRAAPFNLIFDNSYDNENITKIIFSENSEKETVDYNTIYNNKEYQLLSKKIRFSKNVREIINNELLEFDDNTLGIHFRFTDMNVAHSYNNPTTYTKYLIEIKKYLEIYNIRTIFIASDNNETLNKIINENDLKHIKFIYRNVKRYDKEKANELDMIWYKNPDTNSPHPYLNNFSSTIFNINDPNTHLESIIDCIMLSKCNYLIFTYSNISNLSILMSDNKLIKSKV